MLTVSKQAEKQKFNILDYCKVNSNEEGDRFVGIRVEKDKPQFYFPIGYALPKAEKEIRKDIQKLIRILFEFTTKKERVLPYNKDKESKPVEFPFNAYKNVIEYFFSNGRRYYTEVEPSFKTCDKGKQDWGKTLKRQVPLVQQKNGISNFIYTKFTVKHTKPNESNLITQINRICVYEAFQKIGWLYTDYKSQKTKINLDIKTIIYVLNSKLANTNDDKKKMLFQSMKDMMLFIDKYPDDRMVYFGTEKFEYVWEKLIDNAFGEKDKQDYLPRSRWILRNRSNKEQHALIPDTIMILNDKYYIIDAKYYRYGCTGIPDHLPDSSSINKQITYGEYLEKLLVEKRNNSATENIKQENKYMEEPYIYNAFLMPYNKNGNLLQLHVKERSGDYTPLFVNIGTAIGDWRKNTKDYEKIQGVVVDVRELMYKYKGDLSMEKLELASCIVEGVEHDGNVIATGDVIQAYRKK